MQARTLSVQRGAVFGVVAALVVSAIIPAASALADTLNNPLTERSLLLSSSAPGFQDTDGAGYSTEAPNPASEGTDVPGNYAPAGSGPNGKKTGQTFTFRTSSSATLQAYTFQYCTTAAGLCQAPGNNSGDARDSTRQSNADAWAAEAPTSDLNVEGEFTQASGSTPGAGQFQISIDGVPTAAEDWTLSTTNWEDDDFNHPNNDRLTGKNNLMTLRSSTGDTIPAGARVSIEFQASEDIYISNPGTGAFFVKINTYDSGSSTGQLPDTSSNIVDGGVTVANVMTDSIHISTKVLETMAFSVGTTNRDTVDIGEGQVHGTCDPIRQDNNNLLNLGNPSAEYSLETGAAWDQHSYWRLSSNSSGGATVYYSGNTLANTVGDEIAEMPNKAVSTPGTEQFGLGFVDAGEDTLDTGEAEWAENYVDPRSYPFRTLSTQDSGDYAPGVLATQPASIPYNGATGDIDDGNGGPGDAQFRFLKSSLTTPEPIAQQNDQVISCATAKMRYVANIAADTPAGVYTTKINYLAAPQY